MQSLKINLRNVCLKKIYKIWYSAYIERELITPTDSKTQNNLKNTLNGKALVTFSSKHSIEKKPDKTVLTLMKRPNPFLKQKQEKQHCTIHW